MIGVSTDSSFERYHQSTIDFFHPFLISQFITLMQLPSFLFPIFPLFILVLRLTILGFASAVIEVEERTLEFPKSKCAAAIPSLVGRQGSARHTVTADYRRWRQGPHLGSLCAQPRPQELLSHPTSLHNSRRLQSP